MRSATERIETVAVIGCNVAGATAATLLARSGRRVLMFNKPLGIAPRVGESLLPSAVPILQRLVPEMELRKIAMIKPGLTFVLSTGRQLSFNLRNLQGISETYAYNVPRPAFDELLEGRAVEAGAVVVRRPATVRAEGDRILLDESSLSAAGLTRQPDFVVDASGRAQVVRHALGRANWTGARSAVALYGHFTGVDLGAPVAGHAVISPMRHGWCWRIPLPDCMSVGVVRTVKRWNEMSGSPREKLLEALREDQVLGKATRGAQPVSDILAVAYSDYEADRFFGENWALVGDAAGFVDPTLSPGVTLALLSASELADSLSPPGLDLTEALVRWEARTKKRLQGWREVVGYFYDGSLFAIIQQGEDDDARMPWLWPLSRYMKRSIGSVMVGARTDCSYHLRLIRWLARKGLRRYRPADWAIQ
jgi:flavin-dependent dehydrogenase